MQDNYDLAGAVLFDLLDHLFALMVESEADVPVPPLDEEQTQEDETHIRLRRDVAHLSVMIGIVVQHEVDPRPLRPSSDRDRLDGRDLWCVKGAKGQQGQ